MKEHKLPKIFEIDYLIGNELTEDDLYNLFETESLNYSFIIEQYRFLNEYTSPNKISQDFTRDNGWLNKKHFHSIKERQKFVSKIEKAVQNIYQYSEFMAKRWVAEWMFHYGFSLKH